LVIERTGEISWMREIQFAITEVRTDYLETEETDLSQQQYQQRMKKITV